MTEVKSAFSGFTAEKSSADVLRPGEHAVRLMWAKSTNSFTDHKGANAEKDREWADPTPQILVQFGSDKGVFMHRFNMRGYRSFDDMNEKEIEKHSIVNSGGYACKVDKDGDSLRVKDATKTEACSNIINDFLFKIGGADHDGADTDKLIAEKQLVIMKLEKDESPLGNGRTVIKYFREYTPEDAAKELEEASGEGLE